MQAEPYTDSNSQQVPKITNWKPFEKNTLRGFFSITLPSGMVIHGCSLHQKNGARWVGLPAQKYTDKKGATSYTPTIEFTSREIADKFRDQVLVAFDRSQAT